MTPKQLERKMKKLGFEGDRSGDEGLGAQLGVQHVTVWRWRTGKTTPIPTMAALAIDTLIARQELGAGAKEKRPAEPEPEAVAS